LALATMHRDRLHAMLGPKEHHDGIGGHAMAREPSKEDLESRQRSVQDNLALLRRYFDLLFTKDLDSMLELIDDDLQWLVVPTGDVISGKASLAEGAKNHWGASPDRTKKLVNLFAVEDYACMEYISGGTLTGVVDFGSIKIPPSGLK
jgi:SnoaL-like protein